MHSARATLTCNPICSRQALDPNEAPQKSPASNQQDFFFLRDNAFGSTPYGMPIYRLVINLRQQQVHQNGNEGNGQQTSHQQVSQVNWQVLQGLWHRL